MAKNSAIVSTYRGRTFSHNTNGQTLKHEMFFYLRNKGENNIVFSVVVYAIEINEGGGADFVES